MVVRKRKVIAFGPRIRYLSAAKQWLSERRGAPRGRGLDYFRL